MLFEFHPLIPEEFPLFYSVPISLTATPHNPLLISFYSWVLLGGLLNLDQMHVMVSGKVRKPETPPSDELLDLAETWGYFSQENQFNYEGERT